MGLDTIPDRTDGQTIVQSFFNLLKSAIKSDWVPRNTSGVVESGAGSLGTATYPWLNEYIKSNGKIYIGTAEIYLSGDKVMIKDQSGSEIALSDVNTNAANLITLTGVVENATNMGTYTGSTISDNETIKENIQELETQVETNETNVSNIVSAYPGGACKSSIALSDTSGAWSGPLSPATFNIIVTEGCNFLGHIEYAGTPPTGLELAVRIAGTEDLVILTNAEVTAGIFSKTGIKSSTSFANRYGAGTHTFTIYYKTTGTGTITIGYAAIPIYY